MWLDSGLGSKLIEASQAPHFGSSVQKDFDFGLGKDHSADVAALHDHPASGAHLLLHTDHPGSNGRPYADLGGGVGDRLIADEAGYVLAVEQDAVAAFARFETNGSFGGQAFQARALIQGKARAQRLEGEGAVHGPCLQVQQTKMPGQMTGDGALPRSGWAVNSDNELANWIGRAKRAGTHPRFFVPCLGRAENPNLLLLPARALAAIEGFRLLPA